jgi:hypothetical protein
MDVGSWGVDNSLIVELATLNRILLGKLGTFVNQGSGNRIDRHPIWHSQIDVG